MTSAQAPMNRNAVDLLVWAGGLPVTVPVRSDSVPKKIRLTPELLPLPLAMSSADLRVGSDRRGGGSISIEHLVLNAERPAYRALGLALIAYALSPQEEPFRLTLTLADHPPEVAQIVFWPSSAAEIDKSLGLKQRITQVVYGARLPQDNPNYLTFEQQKEDYPREHLPYCRPGSWNVEGGGVTRQGEPVCAHVQGASPSLVWLGKYLLNLTLEDCNAMFAYLYNLDPGESMAPNSAELRFVVRDPRDGIQASPNDESLMARDSDSNSGH
jgi:hypothetical protein